jgi:hypothetical protein
MMILLKNVKKIDNKMAKIIDKRKEIREEGATKVLVASY